MKTVIIVQARMTSSRLPGKILKEVLGKPLLEYQIERLRRIHSADEIVIATTVNETDQPVVDLCERLGVSYFRGSEEDVLARYYGAALQYGADIVVRSTADCPVIDPEISENTIRYFLEHQHELDYVRIEKYPRGLDTEVFSFKVLEESYNEAQEKPEREHVTPFLYRNPERYRIKYINSNIDLSQYRWTVDTEEDYELIKRIIEKIYPVKKNFDLYDIINMLSENADLCLINKDVRQKKYDE